MVKRKNSVKGLCCSLRYVCLLLLVASSSAGCSQNEMSDPSDPSMPPCNVVAACAALQGRGILVQHILVDARRATGDVFQITVTPVDDSEVSEKFRVEVFITDGDISIQGLEDSLLSASGDLYHSEASRGDAAVLFAIAWLHATQDLPQVFETETMFVQDEVHVVISAHPAAPGAETYVIFEKDGGKFIRGL